MTDELLRKLAHSIEFLRTHGSVVLGGGIDKKSRCQRAVSELAGVRSDENGEHIDAISDWSDENIKEFLYHVVQTNRRKIGLVDVDGQGRIKKWGTAVYPNLALCKIAAYHKSLGDDVMWVSDGEVETRYDKVYMSKVFNFSPDYPNEINCDDIVRGGTGYSLTAQLSQEIDDMQPDLSIYPELAADTSYGFLTRGCPNKCKWCVVPRKEGKIHPYWDIDRVANGRKNVVLMDNNILAAGDYCKEQLKKIIERGYRIDFNQAIDARLVTDELAQLIAKVKWIQRRIRFGCDTPAQIKECERAISLINGYGYHGEFFLYTMLNDNFEECWERVNHWWKPRGEVDKYNPGYAVLPYAQPYRDPDNPERPIPKWQKDMAFWCCKHQMFRSVSWKEFEPRKGFTCEQYFKHPELRQCHTKEEIREMMTEHGW